MCIHVQNNYMEHANDFTQTLLLIGTIQNGAVFFGKVENICIFFASFAREEQSITFRFWNWKKD